MTRRTLRCSALAGCLVFLTACVGLPESRPTAAEPSVPDHMILAGQRIDQISIGMSAADLFRVLGPSDEFIRVYNAHSWGDRQAFLSTENRVTEISTQDSRDRTPEGLRGSGRPS
jgi:hypothetical protein